MPASARDLLRRVAITVVRNMDRIAVKHGLRETHIAHPEIGDGSAQGGVRRR